MIAACDRRQVLVALDRFLAAKVAAADDEDHGSKRDNAADDQSEKAFVLVHHRQPKVC